MQAWKAAEKAAVGRAAETAVAAATLTQCASSRPPLPEEGDGGGVALRLFQRCYLVKKVE